VPQVPQVVGQVARQVRAHPLRSFALLVGVLALACTVASVLIDTDREKIVRAVKQTHAALRTGDVEGALRQLTPDFNQEGIRRSDLQALIERTLRKFGRPQTRITTLNLTLEPDQASCILDLAGGFPESRGFRSAYGRSRWRVSLRQARGDWLITEVTPLRIGNWRPEGLSGLARLHLDWSGDERR